MHADTVDFLLKLNRTFYQTFGEQFSETRGRLQPGVLRCLERVSEHERILDLGCGNGALAKTLVQMQFRGQYTGIDSSSALLEIAEEKISDPGFNFIQADLSSKDWLKKLAIELEDSSTPFDRAFLFAVLHHIPGENLRRVLLEGIRSVLRERAELMISVWNFLASKRISGRIIPWEKVGLEAEAVDPGDYLIDWRRGGSGQRYVHHFQLDELEALARDSGFEVKETFRSDGEGGELGLYQRLQKTTTAAYQT